MADKTIGELTRAAQLDDDSLLVMEQQGKAFALEGSKLREFAEQAAADVKSGATFTPALTASSGGVLLSFTNDAGLPNPAPMNVKGEPGAGTNKNLMHNWYFADPINQRGGKIVPAGTTYYTDATYATVAGTTPSVLTYQSNGTVYNGSTLLGYVKEADAVPGYFGLVYTIDRWRIITSNTSVTLSANGATLKAHGTGIGVWRQFVDNPSHLFGKTVTISALLSDGTLAYATGTVPSVATGATQTCAIALFDSTVNDRYFAVYRENDTMFIQFKVPSGGELTVVAGKTELGSVQTFAHQDANGKWVLNDPPPDKGVELLKCVTSTADSSDAYANKMNLHTGNKPSGSYTGNGSAATRTIATGGIGNVVAVYTSASIAIIAFSGAICCNLNTGEVVAHNKAKFQNGVLTLTTTGDYVNFNGNTYAYQVL